MKIKTSELIGPALGWAVAYTIAQAENQLSALRIKRGWPYLLVDGGNPYGPARPCDFSTDWSQGGPIIEREGIEISPLLGEQVREPFRGWFAGRSIDSMDLFSHEAYGPTPLIAAMRCYVSSRLGDEVDVPEELTQ